MGSAFCSISVWSSDKRFKTNINELSNISEKIAKLKGYSYEFKTDEFEQRDFPKGEQIGFIAQELKEVFPQLVLDDKQGFLAVNYVGFIPVLLQAIKEQQQQIEELKKQNDTTNQKMNSTNDNSNLNPIETGFQMPQNEPNPFTHETVVKYTLPTSVSNAFMAVYDLTGNN